MSHVPSLGHGVIKTLTQNGALFVLQTAPASSWRSLLEACRRSFHETPWRMMACPFKDKPVHKSKLFVKANNYTRLNAKISTCPCGILSLKLKRWSPWGSTVPEKEMRIINTSTRDLENKLQNLYLLSWIHVFCIMSSDTNIYSNMGVILPPCFGSFSLCSSLQSPHFLVIIAILLSSTRCPQTLPPSFICPLHLPCNNPFPNLS